VQVVQVVEAKLRPDAAAGGSDPDICPEGSLEAFLGPRERRLLIGMRHDLRPPARTPGRPRMAFGLANGPAALGRLAGKTAPRVVAVRHEERPAMALAEGARRQQLERLVREIQEADQIRDR
jgi:hypothetical protein